ncbi:MAG: hypothetical protein ACLFWI_27450 [Coleofasciculus sp.]
MQSSLDDFRFWFLGFEPKAVDEMMKLPDRNYKLLSYLLSPQKPLRPSA